MTLLFGNLTLAFVNFGRVALVVGPLFSTPEQRVALETVVDEFRRVAANDALYLLFIGKLRCNPQLPSQYLSP